MPDSAPITLPELDGIGIEQLSGVGPKRRASFEALEIRTVLDLLVHYPRRYIDRTREASIAELTEGEEGMVIATVREIVSARAGRPGHGHRRGR